MRVMTRPGDLEADKRIAEATAARIIEYWKQRDITAQVWVELVQVGSTVTYGIRSNMKNGMPQNG